MSSTEKAPTGYTPVAKLLHWLVAVLIAGQFAVGLTMPHIGRNTTPDTLINLHFSFGVLIFAVVIVRLAWRWTHSEPAPLAGVPQWMVISSRAVHFALYFLLLIIPVLGWMNASFRGFDVTFFGLFTLPPLLSPRAPGFAWTGDIHANLSYFILLTIVGLHILATLYHAVIRRDGVLARMLPGG
jgi:cytochrome b561